MKTLTTLLLFIPFLSFAQKELIGQWDLQFMTWNDSIVFDIQNEDSGEQETSVSVNFETSSDSVNEEMNNSGAFEAWKNSNLKFINKKAFVYTSLVIINGIYGNESYEGSYNYDPAAQTLKLEAFTENGKTKVLDVTYQIEISGDQIHLTLPESPGYNAIYKMRK